MECYRIYYLHGVTGPNFQEVAYTFTNTGVEITELADESERLTLNTLTQAPPA